MSENKVETTEKRRAIWASMFSDNSLDDVSFESSLHSNHTSEDTYEVIDGDDDVQFQVVEKTEVVDEPVAITTIEETVVMIPNEDFSTIHVIAILNRDNMQTSSAKITSAGQLAYFLESRNISKDATIYVSDNPRAYYAVDATAWFGIDDWTAIKSQFQLRQL